MPDIEKNSPYAMKFTLTIRSTSAGGATSLLMRATENQFTLMTETTIGTKLKDKRLTIKPHQFKFRFFDVAGHPRFNESVKIYSRKNCDAYIACLDLTDNRDFKVIREQIAECIANEVPIFLFANKADLATQRFCSDEEIAQFAKEIGAQAYFICSAKDNMGVEAAFGAVYNWLLAKHAQSLVKVTTPYPLDIQRKPITLTPPEKTSDPRPTLTAPMWQTEETQPSLPPPGSLATNSLMTPSQPPPLYSLELPKDEMWNAGGPAKQ